MMIRRMILSMVLLCCLPANGMALEVAEAVVTTRIEDRAPVDAIQAYSATVANLVRAYVTIKTHPQRSSMRLVGRCLSAALMKEGFAEWQLLEEE